MAAIAIGVAQHECRTCAGPRAFDKPRSQGVHGADVLPIHAFRRQAESRRSCQDVAGSRLRVVGIFVVHIVFAGVDDRQLPELGHVHGFVEHALAQRALAKEADANPAVAELLGRKCGSGGDRGAATHDGVGAEISRGGIGNVHRSAFAAAVAGLFAEQFGKHAVWLGALGQAMTVAAMRAGDVVIRSQRFTNSHGDGLFAFVEVGETGHKRAQIEVVGVFLELADRIHAAVHAQQLVFI